MNEGFATWMQSEACDDAFPDFGARDERVLDKNVAMKADVLPSSRPVRPSVTRSDQIYEAGGWSAYQKGAAVLAMLESWVGKDAFRGAISSYLRTHADGAVTSKELFATLDERAGKPVSKIAKGFLDQSGVPVVTFDVQCKKGLPGGTVHLSTAELTSAGIEKSAKRWSIPVCLRVPGEESARCIVLDGEATVETPQCPEWVVPNADESGYFRYLLSGDLLDALLRARKRLNVKERAGLIADTWALAAAGVVPMSRAVDVLDGMDLGNERSRVVLQAAVDVLTEMRHDFVDVGPEAARHPDAPFVKWVHRILDAQTARLGAEAKAKDESEADALTRVLVWGALYDLTEDAGVAKQLEPIAARFLADAASVDADLGALALRVSARAGGAAGTSLDGPRVSAAKTPFERIAYTTALASKIDPAALRASLDLLLAGVVRAGDIRYVKSGALRKPDTTLVFFAWMKEHFDELVKKLGGAGALTSTVARTCDKSALDELSAFFEPRLSTLSGAARGYDEGIAEAHRCIALHDRAVTDFATRLGHVRGR